MKVDKGWNAKSLGERMRALEFAVYLSKQKFKSMFRRPAKKHTGDYIKVVD